MNHQHVVELQGITAGYGAERRVLEDCSLTLRAGDRVGLIGANGAGKSTLLEIMIGLHRPESGTIRAFGKACVLETDFVAVRRRVGLLFEDPDDQLFCITVAEDVAFGPFNLDWSRDRVQAAVRDTLAHLGLAGYEERVTWRLSRGEKRLVSLAAVLAMEPEVLLLDEPTAGLDDAHTARLIDVLNGMERTLLIVSHDQPFLRAVTNRTLRLEQGTLHEIW